MKNTHKPSTDQIKTSTRLEKYKASAKKSYDTIAAELGISRKTLYKRVRRHDWTKPEMAVILQVCAAQRAPKHPRKRPGYRGNKPMH